MKKIGIREVAKEAQVSPTTVSRVLNNRGYISEETKTKVLEAMEKLQYYPNELARALFKNETYTVGLIFPTITNPFHAELIQSIELELSNQGYKVLLCNSLNNPEKEKAYLSMLRKNQVDGIIVGTHNNNIDDYNIPGLPIVAIDRSLGKGTITVSCDNYRGGEIATTLLIEEGCKHILCIRGNSKIKLPANSRTLAYKNIMAANKLEEHILEVPFTDSIESKNQIIGDYLANHQEIDGIFAGDDLLASLALKNLEDLSRSVPDEVKLVGFDGAKETMVYNPKLTTIEQPIGLIAEIAVKKLLNMISGQVETDDLLLPVKLLKNKTA
ncbi:LacI family DNA-binding transcriptional regulator [Streptococcaceae bacterium ESL0687]|nr:LacI family DNA-binding transcriptional regulator [Streptococcaceae bacterium ESL0687]